MKIAICGSGFGNDPLILEKAKELGKQIAKSKNILLTGGCRGYPYAALRGSLLENGKIIAYSPAKDEAEHQEKYGFPIDSGIEYEFTGLGIPKRNLPLVKAADSIAFIGGKIGTLNEFTLAFHLGKKIFIMKGSGGITELIPKIAEVCDKKGEKDNVFYFDNVKELKFV